MVNVFVPLSFSRQQRTGAGFLEREKDREQETNHSFKHGSLIPSFLFDSWQITIATISIIT